MSHPLADQAWAAGRETPGSAEPRAARPETCGRTHTFGYDEWVTWGELIRRLKAAGFVEARSGKGSHRQLRPSEDRTRSRCIRRRKSAPDSRQNPEEAGLCRTTPLLSNARRTGRSRPGWPVCPASTRLRTRPVPRSRGSGARWRRISKPWPHGARRLNHEPTSSCCGLMQLPAPDGYEARLAFRRDRRPVRRFNPWCADARAA